MKKELLEFVLKRMLNQYDSETLGLLLEGTVYAEAYRMLCEIYDVVYDKHIPDSACYFQIERILSVFRRRDIETGERHAVNTNEYGEINFSE